jgi:hypothetical protein
MSTNDQTPEPTLLQATPTPPAQAVPAAAVYAGPYGHPHHPYNRAGAAVVVMIVGSLLFAMFAFGAGFTVRGAVDRHMSFGGPGFGRGYDRGFGMMDRDQRRDEGQGWDQGRGGMMRGNGYNGWNGGPQDGQGGGPGFGRGFVPNDGSAPSTPTP